MAIVVGLLAALNFVVVLLTSDPILVFAFGFVGTTLIILCWPFCLMIFYEFTSKSIHIITDKRSVAITSDAQVHMRVYLLRNRFQTQQVYSRYPLFLSLFYIALFLYMR